MTDLAELVVDADDLERARAEGDAGEVVSVWADLAAQ